MIDFADLIMESYVEIIDDLAKRLKIKKGELAEKIWKDYSPTLAARKWRYIRTVSPITGRPQELSLADAYKLAEALDQDPAYLLLKAQHMAEEKLRALQEKEAKTSNRNRGQSGGGSVRREVARESEPIATDEPAKRTRRKRRTIASKSK